MDRGILASGFGWVAAGVVMFATWYFVGSRQPCSCPAVLVGSAVKAACTCNGQSTLAYLGAFIVLIGLGILLFNRRIEQLKRSIIARQQKPV